MSGPKSTSRSSRKRRKSSRAPTKRKTDKRAFRRADVAFLNGQIITLDARRRRTEALTIEHGRIGRIGTNQEILSVVGEDIPIWNLDGAAVLPGFTDCHTHLVGYGLELFDADLRKAQSISEIQHILSRQAQKTEPGSWVLGHGWDQEKLQERRFPNRLDLDAAVPNRPACIFRICEHVCVVNTAALLLAKITAQTTPPSGGVIDRDSKTGEPTGVLRENAMDMVLSVTPARDDQELRRATLLAIQRAVAAGLTSVHCIVDQPQHVRVLHAMNRAGELRVRIYLLITDKWLSSVAEMGISTGFGDDMLRIQAVKIFADGSLGARTAALKIPYSDAPDTTGVLIHSQDQLNARVEMAARLGLQAAIHAIGDRAIEMALAAIEKANLTVPQSNRLRHRIEHASVLNRSLIKTIRRARVTASVQPHFMVSDVWVPERVGPERAKLVYPLNTLTKTGANVVAGSDCPIEPIDPLEGICAAATSTSRGYGESVDAEIAVEMFTKKPAYATHEEKTKGTIEEGKVADLVVLDRDPLRVPPEEIRHINVLATVVGGRLAYASRRFRTMRTANVRGRLTRRRA